MPRSLTALVTLLLAVGFAASPFLGPSFDGFDPDQFPVPQIDPPVQPEGYAFSIWGVIYLWLIIGMGWGLWKKREDFIWHDMRLPLCVSLFVGCFWLAVADVSPVWASVLIVVMLVGALVALFKSPRDNSAFAALSVGLYAGWLSAATCVSLGLLTAGYGWISADTAGLIFVTLAILVAAAVQSTLMRVPTYGIAVIWALVGVVVQNYSTSPSVAALAAGGAIALLLPTFRSWRKN